MREKLHILFRRGLATRFYKSTIKKGTNYERAKELYFINFANLTTMKKNGEFREYSKFCVPKDTEHEWSLEIKENLMNEICSGANLLHVVPLSHMNLPEKEILDAFKLLSSCSFSKQIYDMIQKLFPLFDDDLYKKIIAFFQ